MARTGGILTFCMIAAVVLAFILGLVARGSPAIGVVVLLLYLAAFVMWFVVMIALKVDLAQNGYDRAGGLVWAILIVTIVTIVLTIVAVFAAGSQLQGMGATGATPDPAVIMRAFGVWAVILLVVVLVLQICFLLLGMRLSEYAQIGGGVWKGAGIVLIIATCIGLLNIALYIITILTQAWGIAIVAGILGFIGLLLWAVVWILIGIGFMGDANRMAAQGR
jgi:hypothetical protein